MISLVVSPHFDDAILSLGGTIARWTHEGEHVVIATIYTTGPALAEVPADMRKFADYATRRAEDVAACAVVGAESRYLDRVERAFRRPFLRGNECFTTPASRVGFGELADVTRAVATLFEQGWDRIVLPLGIGNHVDHVEAMVAATDCIEPELAPRVAFYEDFYALSDVIRRAHPVVAGTLLERDPLVGSRQLGSALATIAAARRGPPFDALLAPRWQPASWTVERSDITTTEDTKLDAIRCYASQTKAFGGFTGIARALRAYHRLWNGEPLWRPTL